MLPFLRRILGLDRSEKQQTAQLLRQFQQLKADLGADLPLEDLRPVLIPTSIFSQDMWVGPYHRFDHLPLSLTWAYMRSESTMQYLATDKAEKLEAEGIDWRSVAREALFADSNARKWTFRRNAEDDSVCAALVLHDDLGASRLLCLDQIREMIPNGFSFFVPDRNVVFVLADDAPREIRDQMAEWVHKAYREAEVPMSLEAFTHIQFEQALKGVGFS
jgi:hypothetical protein